MTFSREAEDLFKRVIDADPAQRAALVDAACRDRPALRREIEDLLGAFTESQGFLEAPALGSRDERRERHARRMTGRRIGNYRVTSLIASGGMGTVFLAEQERPRRTVALKVMRSRLGSPSAVRRFEHEAEILARLRHPNIAHVYEAGTAPDEADPDADGAPFLAMEFLSGAHPITTFAAARGLDVRARLDLFRPVVDAVHYAHQNGIIHRDLKPSNILVDETGQPKVIDFGVALSTDPSPDATTGHTVIGELIGTLQYMSPEQCEADPGAIDIRTDVYSLGAVLYELLGGRPPHDVREVALHEAARIVREEAPPRLGAVASHLGRDLETIAMTALTRERGRRYQSAADLARDVDRYLRLEPIEARPPTVWYKARLFARRHRTFVGAAAAILLCLVGAVAVSVASAVRATRTTERAAVAERDAVVRQSYVASMAAAESAWRNEYHRMRTHLAEAPVEHRGWEWRVLQSVSEPGLAVSERQEGLVDAGAWSPDGRVIAVANRIGPIRLSDAATGRVLHELPGHGGRDANLHFSPDGATLVSAGPDGAVRLWGVESGDLLDELDDPTSAIRCVRFAEEGRMVLFGRDDGVLRGWERGGARGFSAKLGGGAVLAVDVSPDGAWIAAGSQDGTVRLLDAKTGAEERAFDGADIARAVMFSVDGTRLFSCHRDGYLRLWDVAGGQLIDRLDTGAPTHALAQTGDGALLAVGLGDHSVLLLDAKDGTEVRRFFGHTDAVRDVAFSPDGTRLASFSWDRTARVWSIEPLVDLSVLRGHEETVHGVAFSPDGSLLASTSDDGVRIHDVRTHEQLAVLRDANGPGRPIVFSPDGRWLVHGDGRGAIIMRDTATGHMAHRLEKHRNTLRSLAFDATGARLVCGSRDETATIWDVLERTLLHTLAGHEASVYRAVFSPDGARVMTASWDETVRVWDTRNGQEIRVLAGGHDLPIYAMALTPDGEALATGGRDQTICIWDPSTDAQPKRLTGHGQFVTALVYHPDGTRMASASWFGAVSIWDTADDAPVATFSIGRYIALRSLAFSPDGSTLAAGSGDGLIRLWHEEPERTRLETRAATLAMYEEAAVIVDRLAAEHDDSGAIADVIRADASLDAALRRTAMNIVLRRENGE